MRAIDKLEPIGRLDVLDDVATKAKEYLGRLPKELVTALLLKQQTAMLGNLGDVLVAQGELQGALDAYHLINVCTIISKRPASPMTSTAISSAPPAARLASLPPIPSFSRTTTASSAGGRKRPGSKRGLAIIPSCDRHHGLSEEQWQVGSGAADRQP